MPVPPEYRVAQQVFESFMKDAAIECNVQTTHMVYNIVVGVFHTFRRRLTFKEAIEFAYVLPPLIRALFIAEWDVEEKQVPFKDREEMTKEVKSVRHEHNFSPDTAIINVATALRKHVNIRDFDNYLSKLSKEAQDYWNTK